jgi:hypothetical protein
MTAPVDILDFVALSLLPLHWQGEMAAFFVPDSSQAMCCGG